MDGYERAMDSMRALIAGTTFCTSCKKVGSNQDGYWCTDKKIKAMNDGDCPRLGVMTPACEYYEGKGE